MTQTLEYMIDVMTRAQAGEQVQQRTMNINGTIFEDDNKPSWNWMYNIYRIKPREPRVIYMTASEIDKFAGDTAAETTDDVFEFMEVIDDD